MKTAVGVINVVQEGRFRLACQDGSSSLFFLHRFASIEPQDLELLAAQQMRVKLIYEDAPGRVAGMVHDILPARTPAFASRADEAASRQPG